MIGAIYMIRNKCDFCHVPCGMSECGFYNGEYMRKEDEKWFDEGFGMSPYGENRILFTAEYLAFYKFPAEYKDKVISLIEEQIDENGEFTTENNGDISHDNRTAIVCLSRNYGLDYHKKVFKKSLVHSMLHPRDFIFYCYAAGGLLGIIGTILYPIALLAMMHSCYSNTKIRNGVRYLKTDGKLLTWLRCKSFKLPLTAKICTFIIDKNKEFIGWKEVFRVYFQDAGHPHNRMPKEWYDL